MIAAVGAACAAGLPILAAVATAAYLALSCTKPLSRKIADRVNGDEGDDG